MSATEVRIDVVGDEAAGELLTLRRAAFVTEAQLYDDPNIPPLTQTLAELRADLADPDVVTLGAWSGTRLVGSIRVGATFSHPIARCTISRACAPRSQIPPPVKML